LIGCFGSAALLLAAGCEVEPKPPELLSLSPSKIPGNTEAQIQLSGRHFDSNSQILLDAHNLVPNSAQTESLSFKSPHLSRGTYDISVQTKVATSNRLQLLVGNSVPLISAPGTQLIEAGKTIELVIKATDFDEDPLTVELLQTPTGSSWDATTKTFKWTTQLQDGDTTHNIGITASDGADTSSTTFNIQVVETVPKQEIDSISPRSFEGNRAFELTVHGENFTAGDLVYIDENALPSTVRNTNQISAQVPPQSRDFYDVTVRRSTLSTSVVRLEILNSTPNIELVSPVRIPENQEYSQTVRGDDFDGDELRVYALDLPPGARFDASNQTLRFRPDFIQGNQTHDIIIAATDGEATQTATITLTIEDSIRPPWPTITSTEVYNDHYRIRLSQSTDDYLESSSQRGRSYVARAVIPDAASETNKLPVRVFLHGFGGAPYTGGAGDQFRIYPADPDNTYWWGRSEGTSSPNYTQRRVLHLVEWLLHHYPGADSERVYVTGPSMGGAGSAELGILQARHFSHVESTIGQMIARNHRPSRIRQLSGLWGSPEDNLDSDGIGVWDRQDLTRALRDEFDAQNQFIYTKHGKDDPTIHFGAVTRESPQTMYSFYDAVQAYRIGHFIVWDEGGHGSADPRLGNNWWDDGWNRAKDDITYLKRNLAFPAFSNSSADDDPGDGSSNGRQTWDDTRGYSGSVATPGDTGWNGDLAGAKNRYLRWDSRAIVDTWKRFEIPLRAKVDTSGTPPSDGYPPPGEKYFGQLPILADVTLRRIQAFHCQPLEPLTWVFGTQTGIIRATDDGTVTIPQLEFGTDFKTLILVRTQD